MTLDVSSVSTVSCLMAHDRWWWHPIHISNDKL